MYTANDPKSPPRFPADNRYNSAETHHTNDTNYPGAWLPAYNFRCNWREFLNHLVSGIGAILVVCLVASVLLGLVFYSYCKAGGSFLFVEHPTFTVSSLRLAVLNVDSMDELNAMMRIHLTAHNPGSLATYNYGKVSVAASSSGIPIGDGLLAEFELRPDQTTVLSTAATAMARRLNATAASDLTENSEIPVEINLKTKAHITSWLVSTVKVETEVRCEGIRIAVPKGKVTPPPSFPNAPCEVTFRLNIFLDMMKEVLDLVLELVSIIAESTKEKETALVEEKERPNMSI